MKTDPLGPFLGINNRLPDFALKIRTQQVQGNFLRDAEDVDIDNAGHVRSRMATTLVQAMTGAHSLHMTSDTTGYLVRASTIYAITLPTYSETLCKILSVNDPVDWLDLNGDVFYSNGTDSGRFTAGTWYPWALPTPASPTVVVGTGTLFAGWYQVGLSYYNATTGEEGGAGPSSNFNLLADGGLQVTLPAAVPGATHINVYVSGTNGEVPTMYGSYVVGTTTVNVTASNTGREAFQRYEAPLPAGDKLFEHNGRLCSINGSRIYVGVPYRPGYYIPAEGSIPFPSAVTNAISAQSGVYVTADKSYFIPGDLGDVKDQVTTVLPYGATKGTAFKLPHNSKVGWFGAKGLVIGDIQGEVEAVMSDNVDLSAPAISTVALLETNGYRRVVIAGWCVNLENEAATRYSGYDFTSISGYYGTKADGIYTLNGSGAVPGYADFGKLDFGVENLKHMPAVYLGGVSDTALSVRIQCVDAKLGLIDNTYTARSFSTDATRQRVDPGKGLRSSWYDMSVVSTDSTYFNLASVSFADVATSRRI